MNFHKGLTVQLTLAIDDLMYNFVQQPNSLSFQIVFSNRARSLKAKPVMMLYTKMVTWAILPMKWQVNKSFFSGQEKKKKEAAFCMHASLTHSFYKMNFPRKNPMKMAAITTRSDGRELEPLSLRAKAVGDPDLSECATFLSLKPSS